MFEGIMTVCTETFHIFLIFFFYFFTLGGWWVVGHFGEISGTVSIEMHDSSYVHALDTGLFTLGAPHKGTAVHSSRSLYHTSGKAPSVMQYL